MSALILLAGLAVGGLGRVILEEVDLTFSFSSTVFKDSRLAMDARSLEEASVLVDVLRAVGVMEGALADGPEPEGTRVGVADAVEEVD